MHFLGLHIIDLAVIVAYFAVVLYIGYRAMKKIKNQEDFFLGGRSFNPLLQTFLQFGQATSSESAVQTVSMVGVNGIAGAMPGALSASMMNPITWLFPKWLRRLRLISMAEYFVDRFKSKKLAALYAIAQTSLFLLVGGMGLYAMSKTVCTIAQKPVAELNAAEQVEYQQAVRLGELEARPAELLSAAELGEMEGLRRRAPRLHFSYINQTALIITMAIFVLLYTAGGGLEAAAYTDALQGSFILILTVLLIPFGMVRLNAVHGTEGLLGPFQAIHQILPESMFDIFGSPRWVELTWYNMLILVFITIAGNIAYSNNLVVSGAARTEKVASFGGMGGSIIKQYGSFLWMVLALLILGIFGEQTSDPDMLWGLTARTLLPVGLLGLMMACLLAALMSTADAHMMTVSGLLTNNIYKLIMPNRADSHYVNAGRILGVVYTIGAILFAVSGTSIYKMWKFMALINIACGPAMLLGFLWRRTNAKAMWASMGTMLTITLFIPALVGVIPGFRQSEALLLEVDSPVIVKVYKAGEQDVRERARQIEQWDALKARDLAKGDQPASLAVGEKFEKSHVHPKKAVFWDEGVKADDEGNLYGAGLFKPEMYVMHLLGVDFARFTPAKVEGISLLFLLCFPFVAVLVVGAMTRPMDKEHLDRFYGKLRTPVGEDHDADAQAMKETLANPARFDDTKVFPRSNWEFTRQPSYDVKGMCIGVVAGLVLIVLLVGLSKLGV